MRTTLRPLGIGEMLDRAVTLSVRFFVPLGLIWVVYIVPLSVFGYFGTADTARIFNAVVDQVSRAGGKSDPNALARALGTPVFNGFTVAYFALFLLGHPLVSAVLLRSVADAYLNTGLPPLARAYREGLRQWAPLIGITAIWIVLGFLAYFAVLLVALLATLGISLLFVAAKPLGIALAIVAAVALGAMLLFAATLALLAFQVSYMTQIAENLGFVRAFAAGISRVIGRSPLRSLLFGLALIAVNFGLTLVAFVGQAVLFGLLHSKVLGLACGALVATVSAVLVAALTAIYYYDIRVRTEGLDLQLAAAPQPGEPAT